MGTLGDAIRAAYKGQGFTQRTLAAQLGVEQNTVSRWVTHTNGVNLDTLARIEDAVGRPRGWILVKAGYVVLPESARDAIAMDPNLNDGTRPIVLAAYDAGLQQ